MSDRPRSCRVVCTTRAQPMAAALLEQHAAARSGSGRAGSEPADRPQPGGGPGDGDGRDRHLGGAAEAPEGRCAGRHVVITMGCGDACPVFPGSAMRTGSS